MIKNGLIIIGSIICSVVLSGGVEAQSDIWTSAQELGQLPMAGPAWQAVLDGANQDCTRPNVGDKDDPTNVNVLAAAIVYARTGDVRYKEKVVYACKKIAAGAKPKGRTLAWARETGAYAMAADLVGYRTRRFEAWLRKMAEIYVAEDGRTLLQMFYRRPNNWGAHAFGSLCAIYRYLDRKESLAEIRAYWVRSIEGPNPGLRYGRDKSWHVNDDDLRWINPKNASKGKMNIDGIIPDDMRRGGPFRDYPIYTNYVWGGQQGLIMAARILDRAGMSIWEVGDRALYRAAVALEVRMAQQFGQQWKAEDDDQWILAFLDRAYGSNLANGQPDLWGAGKNTGWAYVALADDLSHSGGEKADVSPASGPTEDPGVPNKVDETR